MARWAHKEEEFLKNNVSNYTEKELAKILNRSVRAIKNKKTRLGIKAGQRIVDGKVIKQREWTDEDDKTVIEWYEGHEDDLMLDELAEKMGRTPEFICRQANRLGLTRFGRKPSWFIEEITNNLNEWNESEEGKEQREINLRKMKQIVKTKHPKGMKGKTHSEEYKKAISARVKKYWANITPEELERQIDKQIETRKKNGTLNPMKNQTNPYSRARGGKRADLNNQYFRSSWEANIARYLNHVHIEWVFEPREFIFNNENRGSISYTPDFYLPELDKWIEVKGWMDNRSKDKLTKFKEYFPEEFEKLEIIGSDEYNKIKKNAQTIPNWEDS